MAWDLLYVAGVVMDANFTGEIISNAIFFACFLHLENSLMILGKAIYG